MTTTAVETSNPAPAAPAPVQVAPPLPPTDTAESKKETSAPRAKPGMPAAGAAWLVVVLLATYLSDRYLTMTWTSMGVLVAARFLPSVAAVLGLFLFVGYGKFGMLGGALITPQNVISLSRLQMVLWTVLVLSLFAAVALARLADSSITAPLSIRVDSDLWALLGISSTALVGTPLLLAKRSEKVLKDGPQAASAAAQSFNESPEKVCERSAGPVYANEKPQDARFSDIFEGDELANTHLVDIAKVQMFVFTVISALVWAVAGARLLGDDTSLRADAALLPSLPSGMITLLGISNAGYLVNKLVDHTPTK